MSHRGNRRSGRLAAVLAVITIALASAVASVASAAGATRTHHAGAARVGTPKGFVANALAWRSGRQGWLLGNAPCKRAGIRAARREPSQSALGDGLLRAGTVGSSTPPKTCTYVIGTSNGGTNWSYLGAVAAPLEELAPGGVQIAGVTELRFFSRQVGWVIGSDLFHTINGGRTWLKEAIPGGGKQVLDLATTSGAAFALVSGCRWQEPCSAPLSLWRSTKPSSRTWSRVRMNLPSNTTAQVVTFGKAVYVSDPLKSPYGKKDLLYASTNGGASFTSRPVACDAAKQFALESVAASSSDAVALLCAGESGGGESPKTAYRSGNSGRTYTNAGSPSRQGTTEEMALSSAGDMVVASWFAGSYISVNDSHHRTWVEVAADPDSGMNDLQFVGRSEALVIYGPASSDADVGELFVTHDGGQHWSQVSY